MSDNKIVTERICKFSFYWGPSLTAKGPQQLTGGPNCKSQYPNLYFFTLTTGSGAVSCSISVYVLSYSVSLSSRLSSSMTTTVHRSRSVSATGSWGLQWRIQGLSRGGSSLGLEERRSPAKSVGVAQIASLGNEFPPQLVIDSSANYTTRLYSS